VYYPAAKGKKKKDPDENTPVLGYCSRLLSLGTVLVLSQRTQLSNLVSLRSRVYHNHIQIKQLNSSHTNLRLYLANYGIGAFH
jgi:hypothetical protein